MQNRFSQLDLFSFTQVHVLVRHKLEQNLHFVSSFLHIKFIPNNSGHRKTHNYSYYSATQSAER